MTIYQASELEIILQEDRVRASASGDLLVREEIDAALERLYLYPGSYGLCIRCGEEIDSDRLHIVPATRYCEDHAEMRPPVRMGVRSGWDGAH